MKRLVSTLTAFALISTTSAKDAAPAAEKLTPASMSERLQHSLAKVRAASVSLTAGGYASGVIIDTDGTTLTAAHVLKMHKPGKKIKIKLEDGREFEADPLGYNEETDIAVVKIKNPKKEKLPVVELAASAPVTGSPVFIFAHPSGELKGRPAQVRLGRITSTSIRLNKASVFQSDCNIQPGDSGGPMFDLNGKLVAISSSAAGIIDFNRFASVEQFKLERKKLLAGEKWGDPAKGPVANNTAGVKFTKDIIAKVQAELMRRYQSKHLATSDFILSMANAKGEVKLDSNKMVNFMTKDALAIALNQPVSLGLDDPAITKHLPAVPKHGAKLRIMAGGRQVCYGIAIDESHIVTKLSCISKQAEAIGLKNNKGAIPLTLIGENKKWDIAVLQLEKKVKLPVIQWSPQAEATKPGQALFAPDHKNRAVWGVATDERRVVSKARSLGPLRDKKIISKHRAPYPNAIRHALPLFAADAGTPIYDLDGNFVGMHTARFSRTMGLIIASKDLQAACDTILKKSQKAK